MQAGAHLFFPCWSLCHPPGPRTVPGMCWRSFFDSAVDGIVVIDGRGLIEARNPAAERLFGSAEQRDVVGQHVKMFDAVAVSRGA